MPKYAALLMLICIWRALHATHYDTLKIRSTASDEEIRKAYRSLARSIHPDKDPNNPYASSAFQKLGSAYEVLKNPELRNEYDLSLHNGNETDGQCRLFAQLLKSIRSFFSS